MQWAAIHVVLALTQRFETKCRSNPHDLPDAGSCIREAESVLTHILTGDVQLLHIQVLVGMITLLQAQQDLKPASTLLAVTMRLAHSIGLHDAMFSEGLNPEKRIQKARVFWLLYILDKDLSMRLKQPSIQLDDDINLEVDSFHTGTHEQLEDGHQYTGVVSTSGNVKMDFLAIRVQLAAVQGAVYDYIYSTRSRKRSLEERSHALESVARALEQWKASIPDEFSTTQVIKLGASVQAHYLAILYSTSLACTTLIYQAHAWNEQWVNSLHSYSLHGIVPRMPPSWDALVSDARALLVLCATFGTIDSWRLW